MTNVLMTDHPTIICNLACLFQLKNEWLFRCSFSAPLKNILTLWKHLHWQRMTKFTRGPTLVTYGL